MCIHRRLVNWSFFTFFSQSFIAMTKQNFSDKNVSWREEINFIQLSLILFDNRYFHIMCSGIVFHSHAWFRRDNVQVVTYADWQEHVFSSSCRKRNCRNPHDVVTQMCHILVCQQTGPWGILLNGYLLFPEKASTWMRVMHLCLY